KVTEPPAKLMVAMFDTPAGMDAYFGKPMSDMWSGIYDLDTNRLVVHDQGARESYQKFRKQMQEKSATIASQVDRQQYQDAVRRYAEEARRTDNVSLIMHEVSHHLSFNCGLLNREGDVPAWLAEGLACYCEATRGGAWQGIGEVSDTRLRTLADHL